MSPTHFHPTPLLTLAPHLTPHLPHSLPLLRRLQHHHSSPHAHILATFPPSPSPPPPSYSALWIDRSRGPETECWLFSTYELPPSSPHNPSLSRLEILALFNAVAQLPPPPNRPPGTDYIVVGSLRESLVHLLGGEDLKYITPQSVLPTDPATLPDNASLPSSQGGILAGLSTPYMKWIIAPPPPLPPSLSPSNEDREKELHLPPGYTYDRPRASHGDYALVLSRTSIPRSEATLSQLGSVGIRYLPPYSSSPSPSSPSSSSSEEAKKEVDDDENERGQLISWAFLGPDGSLTSLHVEPAHRGKGLAKAVAKRLFKELREEGGGVGFATVQGDKDGDGEEEEEGGWAHSDVAVENRESAGVARAVGGREGWVVRWCHVDLGRVRAVVKDWEEGGSECGWGGDG